VAVVNWVITSPSGRAGTVFSGSSICEVVAMASLTMAGKPVVTGPHAAMEPSATRISTKRNRPKLFGPLSPSPLIFLHSPHDGKGHQILMPIMALTDWSIERQPVFLADSFHLFDEGLRYSIDEDGCY